jgi:hypothetical protein
LCGRTDGCIVNGTMTTRSRPAANRKKTSARGAGPRREAVALVSAPKRKVADLRARTAGVMKLILEQLQTQTKEERQRASLASADSEFQRTGDPLDAFGVLHKAIRDGLPVPDYTAQWVQEVDRRRLEALVRKPPLSLAAALRVPGKSPGRAAKTERAANEMKKLREQMTILIALGATVSQAADMIAASTKKRAAATLESSYRRTGEILAVDEMRYDMRKLFTESDVRSLLDSIPDTAATRLGKARIRALYPKVIG